jgi:hypothetical protein
MSYPHALYARFLWGHVSVALGLFGLAAVSQAEAADPATVQEARSVLDLATFPLAKSSGKVTYRRLAGQSYLAADKPPVVAQEITQQLVAAGWKEADGSTSTPEYVSALFSKGGYALSLTVLPAGGEMSSVLLQNHGNVDLARLVATPALTPLLATGATAMLQAAAPAEQLQDSLRKQLVADGWTPYGEAGPAFNVRRNAVLVTVAVSAAPTDAGRSIVQLTSQLLSFEIPAPPGAESVQFADATGQLSFDLPQEPAAASAFYREELARGGWEPTTDKPVKIGLREHLIFRNAAKELIELQMQDLKGKTRCVVKAQTAAEVAAEDKLAAGKASAAQETRRKQELAAGQGTGTVPLATPAGGRVTASGKEKVEFSLKAGGARAATQTLLKQLTADGWKVKPNVEATEAGDFDLEKGALHLHVTYLDPGFIEGTISVTARAPAVLSVAPSK